MMNRELLCETDEITNRQEVMKWNVRIARMLKNVVENLNLR